MVATSFETHHHYHHQSEPKMNDIFEQTVIVDKPLSSHFYDHLKEVTIDAEIIVGRKGIVEEVVPLEQWATVISQTFTAIPEEDWVIEPEEVVYTVVKWEGVEGGEKHIVENKKWTEVAHTPPIHTRHHISPLTGLETEIHESNFTFSSEDLHNKKAQESKNSESTNKIVFEKPHVSATTETTWHSSHHQHTTANHQSSEFSNNITNGNMNGYKHTVEQNDEPWQKTQHSYTVEQNDEPLGAWHKVQSPVEYHSPKHNNASSFGSYQTEEEERTTWQNTHFNQTPRPYQLHNDEEKFTPTPPTRIPKPRTSPSAYEKLISPESPKQNGETRITSPKVILKSNGNTVFSGGYSPQPSPPAVHHQFISAKPACHSTFMTTSYTSNNSSVSSPEHIKSPPRTPGTPEKVTWRRTHGNQYVRETVSANNSK
uniref:Uncharacterized protein n=1 Tax=Panagrolaimus sp. ES5 TaxID=591445 RepID=A0AC34FEF9_9BILA